jgi:hypothetical protein
MKFGIKLLLLIGCPVLLLCSCATVGRDFNPNLAGLKLGQFKLSDCKKLYGEPNSESDKTTSDGEFDILNYHRGVNVWGTINARVLILEFKNGMLNGYVFASSFKKDKTGGDLTKVDQVKAGIGKFSRDDVTAILGQPSGKALAHTTLTDYKDVKAEGTEIWGWFDMEGLQLLTFTGARVEKSAYIYVVFDDGGKVKDVQKTINRDEVNSN